jgi:hypothetical protein
MSGCLGGEKTEHKGEENMEEDIRSSGTTRNMENEK